MTNLETEPSPLPPPLPAPIEPTERRWARSDDRVVLGVAGGLGRALAIDPLFIRVAFVVMSLFSGVGILLYVAAFLLLADSPTSPPPSIIRRIVGIVAALSAARWLFAGDAHLPEAGWVVAIGLLGAAVALWRGRGPSAEPPPVVEPRPAVDGGATTTRWQGWSAQRRERPRPPRSPLGLLTIGAAAVIGAAVWLFNDGAGNRGTLAFGWATLVLGAGLLVGTFAGRARWLIVPAAATAAAAVAAAALNFAGVGLTNHAGDRSEYLGPGSVLAPEYRTGVGDIDLWLVDYPDDASTSVEAAVGDVRIVVPDDARVQIDARVGLGSIDALGSSRDGYRRALVLDSGTGTGTGTTISLRVRVGVGSIDVQRASTRGIFRGMPTPGTAPMSFDGSVLQLFGDGTTVFTDGSIDFGDGWRIEADGSYQIPIVEQQGDGSVRLDNGAMILANGDVLTPGGFLIARPDARPTTPGPATTYATLPLEVGTTTTLGVQP